MATRKGRAPGGAIQAYLCKQRISQKQFAESLDVSQGLVSQWVTGVTQVSPEYAKKIELKHGIPRLVLLYPEESTK
jgi:plasmid maintenance system antidote protein VapI